MQLPRFWLILTILFFLTSHPFAHTVAKADSSLSARKIFPVSGFLAASCNALLMEAREYVCDGDMLVSDLRWPLVPSASYTVYGGIYLPKGIHIEGNVSFLQPMATGTMIDKDFEGLSAIVSQQPELTKRSEHACSIISGVQWMVKAGVQLAMPQSTGMRQVGISVFVEPMISFYYSVIKWHSYNGYLQYAKMNRYGQYEPWTETLPRIAITQAAVSYQQHIMLPAIGLGWEVLFPHNITLNTDMHLNPNISAITEDIHHARNLRFVDILQGGWAFHGTTRLAWQFHRFFAAFCSLFYQYAKTTDGISIIYNGITSKKPAGYSAPHTAGTALYGCTFSAGLVFTLGR